MSEIVKIASKYKVGRAINKTLNCGIEAQIDNFLDRVSKTLLDSNKDQTKNTSDIVYKFEKDKIEIEEEIEDQKSTIKDTLNNVDPKHLNTNKAQKEYLSVYLKNIKIERDKLKSLKSNLATLIKDHKEDLDKGLEFIKETKELHNLICSPAE